MRRSTMTKKSAFLPLAFLLIFHVIKATALSGNATVAVYNSTKKKIHARVVDASTSSGSMDYAVPPNSIRDIPFEQGKRYALFFATGCSEDKNGHLKDCLSGNCPENGCSVSDPPAVATLVATMIYYDNGTLTTSTRFGYNFGLQGAFLCDCDCSSISCIIPLNKCPPSTILEESGSPMACKAGDGVPLCEDDTTAPSVYSPPSTGTSCFDGAVMKITVSNPPKE